MKSKQQNSTIFYIEKTQFEMNIFLFFLFIRFGNN